MKKQEDKTPPLVDNDLLDKGTALGKAERQALLNQAARRIARRIGSAMLAANPGLERKH